MDHPADAPPTVGRGRLRAILRGAGRAALGLLATLAVGIALLQVDAIGTSVVRSVGGRFVPSGLHLEVERVSGSWLRSFRVVDLRLVASNGVPAFAVDTLRIGWSLPALLSRRLELTRVDVVRPAVSLARDTAGVLRLRGAAPSPPVPVDSVGAPASSWSIAVDSAHVRGLSGDLRAVDAAQPSLVWDEGEAHLVGLLFGPELEVQLRSASAWIDAPAVPGAEATGPLRVAASGALRDARLRIDTLVASGEGSRLSVSGTVAIPDTDGPPGALALDVAADGFPLALLHGALAREPDPTARVDGTLQLTGTTRAPAVVLDLELRGGGRVWGSADASLGDGPGRVAADLTMERLDPGRLLADTLWSGQVDGRVEVALEGARLSRLGGRADLDFAAIDVSGLPVRRASLESVWTDGEAVFQTHIDSDLGTADLSGTARVLDSVPTYELQGPVRVTMEGDSALPVNAAGQLRIEGAGVSPELAQAMVVFDGATVSVAGARLDAATLRARLADGTVAWHVTGSDGARGTLRASGGLDLAAPPTLRLDSATVRNFDLADLLGEHEGGLIDATARGRAVIRDPGQSEAQFDLRVGSARWGAVRVDTAAAVGRLAGGRLTAQLRVRSSAADLVGFVTARPFETIPSVGLDSVSFSNLDLAALAEPLPDSAAPALTTSLNGRVTGRIDGLRADAARADLQVQLGASRVNRQAIASADGRVGLESGRVTVDVVAQLPDSGRVAVEAQARPFLDRPTFALDSFEFVGLDPFMLTAAELGGMNARITGRGTGRIEGAETGTWIGDVSLDIAPSRLNRAMITEGRVDARLQRDAWAADGDLRFRDGRLTLETEGELSADTMSWTLDLGVQHDAPGRLVGAMVEEGHIDATLHVDGRGSDPATMVARFRAEADSSALGDIRVDTLRVVGEVVGGFAHFDTLDLRSNVADATGGGSLPLLSVPSGGASDLSVEIDLWSLAPLEPWVGITPLGLGEGRITASVTGRPDSLRWATSVRTSALLLGRTQLQGLEAEAEGGLAPGLRLSSFDGTLQLDRLNVLGVEARVSRLAAAWDGDEIRLEGDATVDDRRDVVFSLRMDPRGDAPRASLERFDVRIDDDRWALSGSPVVSWATGLHFDDLTLQSGDQLLSLDGRFDPTGTSDLTARVESLRLGGLTDLLGYERLDGTLTSTIELEGPAAAPRVRGDLAADLVWQGGGRSSLTATMAYDTLLLDLDARIDAEGGGELILRGGVPIDLALSAQAEGDTTRMASAAEGPVNLEIRADSFAVHWIEPFLDPTVARGLSGQLDIDARVEGTQAAPSLSGRVLLRDGRLTSPTLGVTYDRAMLDLALEGDRARIDSARVHTDDGTLTLTGGVNLPELSLGEFDLQARLDRFRAVHNDVFRVRLSGTAELVGTTQDPRLEGEVRLVETDVYLDDAVASGASVRPVELTEEELRELEEYLGYSVRASDREPGALFDLLTIDVAVSASRDTWVRQRANPQMEIQVTGDATVTKQPRDSLQFDGRIETVAPRSWVEQFGRRFSIQEGVVELRGTAPRSRVDIRAVYDVPSTNDNLAQASITLDVEGTLNDLSLTLGSEPSMENADIVSYLARGRPASSSVGFENDEGGGGLRGLGSDFALGQVTGLVEGLAAEGVGLDVVEIRTDGLRGATLIAGRFITPSVYVGFKQPVGRSPEGDAGSGGRQDQTEVELEIQALRWLLLNMEAGNSAISFLFRFRYAY